MGRAYYRAADESSPINRIIAYTLPAWIERNVRFREGFRMPAGRDLSACGEGRRPKASEEGTRGPLASGLPSMGI